MLNLIKVGTALLDSIRSRNFWRLILITFALWTTFGVMNGVQYYSNSADDRTTFPLRMITILTVGDAWIRAAITVPIILFLVALHRRVHRWSARVAMYCMLYVIFASAHFLVRPLVLPTVVRQSPESPVSSPKMTYRSKVSLAAMSFWIPDLMGFACIVIAFNAWVYAQETQRRALNEERLAARLASAGLQVLKMQLQPHFLFNTLNTIYNLAPQNSRKAQVMIARLSNLLRLSLDHVSTNMVPLQQELEFLDSYLDIEKTRFEERLQIVQDIDPEALDAAVPNLLLQPLVENAIRHGIGKKAAGGKLEIYAAKRGDRLRIMITDDGRPPQPSTTSSGIGIANTRARLTQLFGSDYSFELLPAGQGAQVLIDLPFKTVELKAKQQEPVE